MQEYCRHTNALFRNVFPLYLLNVNHFILKFKLNVVVFNNMILVAAWCKARIYGLSLAGIAGSNLTGGMDVLSRVIVMCCQVEVSETGRSLIQRSPTERVCVCVCVCVSWSVIECDSNPLHLQ